MLWPNSAIFVPSTAIPQVSDAKSIYPTDTAKQSATDSLKFQDLLNGAIGDGWRGDVLIVDTDGVSVESAARALVAEGYRVSTVNDGKAGLTTSRDGTYHVMLVARDLPSLSGIELTRLIRQREGALAHSHPSNQQKRLPIVAFTQHTSGDDLHMYMEAGMDGCICKPVEIGALLNTVAAAVPPPGAPPARPNENGSGRSKSKHGKTPYSASQELPRQQTFTRKKFAKYKEKKMPKGLPSIGPPVQTGSSANLPVAEQDDVIAGVFQLDAETAIPYIIQGKTVEHSPVFHFVVVQDIFDTWETYQIFFRKIVTKYPGLRVLLFNYPGQAFTEWRRDAVLNNEYLAGCLEALLSYLGPFGNGEFSLDDNSAPFYLVGFGNGGNIAAYFASAYLGRHPNLRALLTVNGFSYVDAHLAGVFHDCMNVFACSPASRPDLPVYFFSRYLFSPAYLSKVGAPLALNLYTAVHNPITLEGRIQLSQGALAHVDVRNALESTSLPFICVASAKNGFVKPTHVQAFVDARGGEERSIKKALVSRRRVCVVWIRAGHEVWQEARRPMSNLMEQLATGYHERNDVSFLPLAPDSPKFGKVPKSSYYADKAAERARARSIEFGVVPTTGQNHDRHSKHTVEQPQLYEDRYIDNVVSTLREAQNPYDESKQTIIEDLKNHKKLIDSAYTQNKLETKRGSVDGDGDAYSRMVANGYGAIGGKDTEYQQSTYPAALEHTPPIPEDLVGHPSTGIRRATKHRKQGMRQTSEQRRKAKAELNPETIAFSRRDRAIKKGLQEEGGFAPEVKEYMAWRLRRNKARFSKIIQAVQRIQRCWRSYIARTLVIRMRQQRAALDIQRWWRGCMGRSIARTRRRHQWAAGLIQRCWRGFSGREVAIRMALEEKSAKMIQKSWRGWRARRFVALLRNARNEAAVKIQSIVRQRQAMRRAWRLRDMHIASTNIQRIWRGRLGRAKARNERDKYLFSKSQSQSIEFGRQMLMEHKLHGTKLQSEVSLLTKEKIEIEEAVEVILKEIATFEAGVRALEREMIELSRAEAEASGTLDEHGKIELRENKMRLDREFGAMLVKIADRREKLQNLENRLQRVDATREAKKEELQDLERKLVVLLEEQQRELKAIKVRQTKKGERLVGDAVDAVQKHLQQGAPLAITDKSGMGGGFQATTQESSISQATATTGPTAQQRAEANALMSSTETMMKFGFMSMSLTYFSSLNMLRAMKQVGAANTILDQPMTRALIHNATNPSTFQPQLKAGQTIGQETVEPHLWSVGDVANWLDTLCLGQYKDAFADAAIDGTFLFDLTDDDLRNTLGIEHALHRKKIIASISRLAQSNKNRPSGSAFSVSSGLENNIPIAGNSQLQANSIPGLQLNSTASGYDVSQFGMNSPTSTAFQAANDQFSVVSAAGAGLNIDEMLKWVRHNKISKVQNCLSAFPDASFDSSTIREQYVPGYGTQYDSQIEAAPFHINKVDDYGNTLLICASQNGSMGIAKLVLSKGANPNHQNVQGNTALHYAMAYDYHELGEYLVNPNGGGADDTIANQDGLTPYDGLAS